MWRKIAYEALTSWQRKTLDLASEVLKNAYNPYSHFSVGAALAAVDGKFFGGANVENAAYGSVICAERSAIVSAYAQGSCSFKALAVIGRGKDYDLQDVITPCGGCRQMIHEAQDVSENKIIIVLSNTKKDKIVLTDIGTLLPYGFGPVALGIDISGFRNKHK
ncbi:MAG: cytidine deaminase [bacterium]